MIGPARSDTRDVPDEDLKQSKIVCVLGMHRSGSSAVARVLNLLGAYLGPDDLLVPPAPDNPKGFWEHRPIVELNDALLARLGGRSMAPPALPSGWETEPQLDDFVVRAREIIERSFAGVDLWAWKDPRACLTLPFWQRVLRPMHYVICVRKPVDVADSLAQRNHVARERSCYLWLLYYRLALSSTSGHPRCAVVFDRLIDKPAHEIAMIESLISVQAGADHAGGKRAAETSIDMSLRHHRRAARDDRLTEATAGPASAAFRVADQAYELLSASEPFDEDLDGLLASGLASVRQNAVPRASSPQI